MSYSEKALQQHVFSFGDHDLRVVCRRLPGEVARVTQTLQLDVEELFASVLDFDIGKPAAAAAPCAGGSGRSDQQSVPSIAAPAAAAAAAGPGQPPDSKKLCGNVASDQPDLIGLDVWPASITLCRYLVRRPQLAAGAAVCELGAGMGLPGLLCAQLGAASVLLTDYEPLVVAQLRQNAALNSLQQRCCFQALDWFDLAPLAPAQRAAQDLLLLADVIYAAAVVEPLVQTLLTLLRPGTGAALAGKPPCVTSAAATGTRLFCCLLCAWAALQIALHSRIAGGEQGLPALPPLADPAAAPGRHRLPPATSYRAHPAPPLPPAGAALVAHRIRRPLVFDRVDKIARLEERDEIFEDFKGACGRAGLHLRCLNDDCPAALGGEEPLLLAIGASEEQLQRFTRLSSSSGSIGGGGECGGRGGDAGGGEGPPGAAAGSGSL